MQITAELKINGRTIDRSILNQDKVKGARYACRKWLQGLMLDITADKVEAVIRVDGKELPALELQPKYEREKLILTKHAEISKYYTWGTLTQGYGRTFGVSYGLNDVSKQPKKKKVEKPVEEIQQRLF